MRGEAASRVLYVDDDDGIRRLAQLRLQREGCVVEVAADGLSGLAMAREGDYDVAVVDYKMPKMDGIAFLRALAESNHRLPVIVATGMGDQSVAVEAMKLGAVDYIVKDVAGAFLDLLPASIDRLRVSRILHEEKRRADEALRASEERHRRIVETAHEGIWTLDAAAVTTLVNQRLCAMLGYHEQEMVGRPFFDFMDATAALEARRNFDRQRQGEGVIIADLPLRHRNGMVVWAIVSTTPLRESGASVTGFIAMIADITERKWAEEALRASEEKYRSIIDTAVDGYWLIDPQGRITSEVNRALCAMLGYRAEEMIGRSPFAFADAENRKILEEEADRITQGADHRSFDVVLTTRDGRPLYTRFSAAMVRDAFGAPAFAFAFVTDISERKRAEESQRLAATVFETTNEAIMVTDAENRIEAINPAFTRITGYSAEEALGKTPHILNSGRHDKEFFAAMWSEILDRGSWQGEVWNRRKTGEVFPEWLSIAVICGASGRPIHFVAVFSDITKRKQAEEIIRRQANYDPLTDLPNRSLFLDRLARAVSQAQRYHGRGAVMFIDLDRFKAVNDSLGHRAGDYLLREASERLVGCIRESDTVARFGGDEFTVILPDISKAYDAEQVAGKILAALARPFDVEGTEVFVSGSVGIAVFPDDGNGVEELLRNADSAMYKAKYGGRGTYRFFTQEMNRQALARMKLENQLRHGLERGELVVHYQPIVDLRSGRMATAEALVRWQHPERGLLPPAEFIPLAEETGLVVPLGEWVLGAVCRQIRLWVNEGCAPASVSVNFSSQQFTGERLTGTVLRVLEETDVPPGRLEIEITETVLLEDLPETVDTLHRLMARGVRFSIDDFGTGYSSLGYLKRFPFDVLKIDRVFVGDVTTDPDDATLAKTIIAMAHGLGLKAVAEGVETAEQLAFLLAQDCDFAQGFYFSHPLPADEFGRLLRDGCQGAPLRIAGATCTREPTA